jgi:hypothetical protein
MLLVLTALDASYATALNRGSADCVLLYPIRSNAPATTGRGVQQRTMLAEQIDSLRTTEEQRRP